MKIENIVSVYNSYVDRRRRDTDTKSSAALVLRKSIMPKFHSFKDVTFTMCYVHPENTKELVSLKRVIQMSDETKEAALDDFSLEFLALWIDFFSENEDRIVEGKVWI